MWVYGSKWWFCFSRLDHSALEAKARRPPAFGRAKAKAKSGVKKPGRSNCTCGTRFGISCRKFVGCRKLGFSKFFGPVSDRRFYMEFERLTSRTMKQQKRLREFPVKWCFGHVYQHKHVCVTGFHRLSIRVSSVIKETDVSRSIWLDHRSTLCSTQVSNLAV